jgi:hypothetical protein
MDSNEFNVKNPDGSTDTYYSYLRGELANQSAHPVLSDSEPVFQGQTHTFGSITSLGGIGASQFAGLALQNPNPGTASVTISWTPVSGQPLFNVVTLPSGKRLVGDIAELVPGATPGSGDSVVITSTAPVQMLAFYGDDAAWTVTPFLPSF